MFWLVFLAFFVFDQLTKIMASIYFEIMPNHGISFGWLNQLPAEIMTIFLIFFAAGIAYVWRKKWSRNQKISGLFWAGVASNLLDRVLFGEVSDWIALPYVGIKNNFADFYISIALILLFIQEFRASHEN